MRDSGVDRPFARRHPVVTVLAVVTAAWWLWQGWYEALAVDKFLDDLKRLRPILR